MSANSYSTGSKNLDTLFGGFNKGVLHCFFGPTSAGKTTFAIYAPIASIYKAEKANITDKDKFFVIDGDGGFDLDRATDCWEAHGLKADDIASHLITWSPTEFDEQHKLFSGGKGRVPGEIERMITEEKCRPLLITADPMVAIYRGIVMRTDMAVRAMVLGSYTAKLDLQIKEMRQLARTHNCPSIITSWPASPVGAAMNKGEYGGEVPILGGRAFGFYPKITVELRSKRDQETEAFTERKAILFKHRSKPVGSSCNYTITDKGLSD